MGCGRQLHHLAGIRRTSVCCQVGDDEEEDEESADHGEDDAGYQRVQVVSRSQCLCLIVQSSLKQRNDAKPLPTIQRQATTPKIARCLRKGPTLFLS